MNLALKVVFFTLAQIAMLIGIFGLGYILETRRPITGECKIATPSTPQTVHPLRDWRTDTVELRLWFYEHVPGIKFEYLWSGAYALKYCQIVCSDYCPATPND